ASADRSIKVWEVPGGQELLTLRGHTSPVHSLMFSPDGKTLLSAAADRTVKTWDLEGGNPLTRMASPPSAAQAVKGLVFSSDGRRLASVHANRGVRVWDTTTYSEPLIHHRLSNASLVGAMLGQDNQFLALVASQGVLTGLDTATAKEVFSFPVRGRV